MRCKGLTFSMWLKNRETLTPFENWLLKKSAQYKLKRYRDFSNFIWHYAHGEHESHFRPFADIFTTKLCRLFDEYEQPLR